jgi:fructokinase
MKLDVLAVGELVADLISSDDAAGLEMAANFIRFQGGSPANLAANLAYLNKQAGLVACVGNDGLGKFLIKAVKNTGVHTAFIQQSKWCPTSLVLVAKSQGTPEFIAYRGADAELQPVPLAVLEHASIVHTTSFALSLPPAQEVILHALKAASSLGKAVSVDWNFAPAIWKKNDGQKVFEEVMQLQPLLKMSLDDVERFFGRREDIRDYQSKLDRFPGAFICLTAGKEGVWYKIKSGSWDFRPAIPVDSVVDTTGAGDAFWAGFLHSFLDDLPAEASIHNGLVMAARKIQKAGPLYQ